MPRNTLTLDTETEQAAFDAVRKLEPKIKPKTLQELISEHRGDISFALKRNCSYEEIADCLKQFNIEVSAATLKRYHRSGMRTKGKKALKETGIKPSERLERKQETKSDSIAAQFSTHSGD